MRSVARLVFLVATRARATVATPLAMGVWAAPAVAVAQQDDTDRVVFVLHDQSPAAGVLQAFDSMQGQLGELELDIGTVHSVRLDRLSEQARQAAEVAEQHHAKAVFWFERAGGSVRVYALHASSGRVFTRDVGLAGDAAVQRERLAIVLRAAVPAVLDGGLDLGEPLLVVRLEPATPAEAPTETLPPPDLSPVVEVNPTRWDAPPRLRAAIGYSVSMLAPAADWQSGAAGELVLDAAGWLRTSLGAGYAAPTTVRGHEAHATVTRVPVVARLGVGQSMGRAAVGLEAGALVEMWYRRTVYTGALDPTPPATRWRPGATLAARLEIPADASMGLYLLGEIQWLPAPHVLTVRSRRSEQQLETYNIRPHVGVGVTLDLLSPTSQDGEVK